MDFKQKAAATAIGLVLGLATLVPLTHAHENLSFGDAFTDGLLKGLGHDTKAWDRGYAAGQKAGSDAGYARGFNEGFLHTHGSQNGTTPGPVQVPFDRSSGGPSIKWLYGYEKIE